MNVVDQIEKEHGQNIRKDLQELEQEAQQWHTVLEDYPGTADAHLANENLNRLVAQKARPLSDLKMQ